jgi:hypothetical protein
MGLNIFLDLDPGYWVRPYDQGTLSDIGTAEAYRSGDQKPVGRVAMFELMQAVAPTCGGMTQRQNLDARQLEKRAIEASTGRSNSIRRGSTSHAISQTLTAIRKWFRRSSKNRR